MADEERTHRAAEQDPDTPFYTDAAGGWGSLKGILQVAGETAPSADALKALTRQNKTHGVMCTACAWPKPAKPEKLEFCENGAKATLWELTKARCTPEVMAGHTLTELRTWHDHDLER